MVSYTTEYNDHEYTNIELEPMANKINELENNHVIEIIFLLCFLLFILWVFKRSNKNAKYAVHNKNKSKVFPDIAEKVQI